MQSVNQSVNRSKQRKRTRALNHHTHTHTHNIPQVQSTATTLRHMRMTHTRASPSMFLSFSLKTVPHTSRPSGKEERHTTCVFACVWRVTLFPLLAWDRSQSCAKSEKRNQGLKNADASHKQHTHIHTKPHPHTHAHIQTHTLTVPSSEPLASRPHGRSERQDTRCVCPLSV